MRTSDLCTVGGFGGAPEGGGLTAARTKNEEESPASLTLLTGLESCEAALRRSPTRGHPGVAIAALRPVALRVRTAGRPATAATAWTLDSACMAFPLHESVSR